MGKFFYYKKRNLLKFCIQTKKLEIISSSSSTINKIYTKNKLKHINIYMNIMIRIIFLRIKKIYMISNWMSTIENSSKMRILKNLL